MHRNYDDIISRIHEPPLWWQENGVPRYDPFHPHWSTGVYASEAVLAEVACQACETTFLVCIETNATDGRLAEAIRAETLKYGDPPNVLCCGRGYAMSTEMIRIVEYWRSHDPKYVEDGLIVDAKGYFKWVRSAELEIAFSDPWGDGDPVPPRGSRWKPAQQRPETDAGPVSMKGITGKRRAGLVALNVMAWFVVGTVYLNLPDQQPSGALFQWAANFYDRTLARLHGNAIPCAGCHYKYGLFYAFLFFDVLAALAVGWAVTRRRERVFPQQVTRFSALFVVLVVAMACIGMPAKGHSDNLGLLRGNWFDVYLICFLTPVLTAAAFF